MVVTAGDVGLTVPAPGLAAGTENLNADGTVDGFQIEVAADGTITYPQVPAGLDPALTGDAETPHTAETTGADPAATGSGDLLSAGTYVASDPGECEDSAYHKNDLRADRYYWYLGDGGMPAAMTQAAAAEAFKAAVDNIIRSENSCGLTDQVGALATYSGTTTFETDMDGSGNCGTKDTRSTWDAGDLSLGVVAKTCWWAESVPFQPNNLNEADVRFNTHDYDFTETPNSSCSNDYDVRSVATHEAGHVFGLGHVGSGHSKLTMFTNSFTCKSIARSLGRGDVLGLRAIY